MGTGRAVGLSPLVGVTLFPSRTCAEMDTQGPVLSIMEEFKRIVSLLFPWGLWHLQHCGCKCSISQMDLRFAAGNGLKGTPGSLRGVAEGSQNCGSSQRGFCSQTSSDSSSFLCCCYAEFRITANGRRQQQRRENLQPTG